MEWKDSYLGQLRNLVGHRMLIAPGARAVIRDREGRILLVRRSDNGAWVMPAGSLEIGESIGDCLAREVREETGLTVNHSLLFAVYSEPRFEYINGFGDHNKMLSFAFLVEDWSGAVVTETAETLDAAFFAEDSLPEIPDLYRETLLDLHRYLRDGRVILK